MSEWQPGDVGAIDTRRSDSLVFRTPNGWLSAAGICLNPHLNPRRLVVIDPEDHEAARRLLETYGQQFTDWTPELDSNVTRLQAALREFAAPTPPKPDEPMGLGAVVEEDDGTKWVRTEDDSQPWVAHLGGGHGNVVWLDWADVAVVRVLSHGVTDGGAS
jgi:hypothetical protein